MRLSSWKRSELLVFTVDLVMLGLILVNLAFILFDGLFSIGQVQDAIARFIPGLYRSYLPTHEHFALYDSWFVAVFIAELLIRWAIAALRKTYHKWWFYPFIHWYDTLGCIPVGSFRFLRVLRIVSILYRLQRNRLIDLTKTYLFRQGRKYYRVLVEEVSDRVVLNVLQGMKDEVRKGSPVVDKIAREVILPRRQELVLWLSDRVQAAVAEHYGSYRADVKAYVDERIERAVAENREISTLEAIPLIGTSIRNTLEKAIADIVFRVLDGVVHDLSDEQSRVLIDELSGVALDAMLFRESDGVLQGTIRQMVTESIDRVADEVSVQQWKFHENQEIQIRARAKRIAAIRAQKRKHGTAW